MQFVCRNSRAAAGHRAQEYSPAADYAPLPGDSVGAAEQLLMNGDPAAAAGTDNHPEDVELGAGAIHRLRKGEAVGIVCHPHRLAKLLHDIPAQIVTVKHRAVAVFNASALRIDSPGQADPG